MTVDKALPAVGSSRRKFRESTGHRAFNHDTVHMTFALVHRGNSPSLAVTHRYPRVTHSRCGRGPVNRPSRLAISESRSTTNKSAPTGAATPRGRGLADREEHDRLMSSLPCPAVPTPACTDPHADGCPECVVNVEESWLHESGPEGCSCAYFCSDCGHEWTTSWGGR